MMIMNEAVAMTAMRLNYLSSLNKSQRLFFRRCVLFDSKFRKMSDKTKNFSAPSTKVLKSKRPSTVSLASSSRPKTVVSTAKEKVAPRSKNKNLTIIGDADTSILKQDSMPDFDGENRQIAYGNFLRTMLEECLVDEKIEREENLMDIQMAQLADRFQDTMALLDNTNRRLKDVSFTVEQQRLYDMKNQDCSRFYETTDTSNAQNVLQHLSNTEQACLDKLETKNIDFGYHKDSGHKQLLDAVNEALDGLEHIKKHSHLDMHKFREYENSQSNLDDLEKKRLDLAGLKMNFEGKFPKFSEKLLKEASEKIAKMIENDDE